MIHSANTNPDRFDIHTWHCHERQQPHQPWTNVLRMLQSCNRPDSPTLQDYDEVNAMSLQYIEGHPAVCIVRHLKFNEDQVAIAACCLRFAEFDLMCKLVCH